MVKEQENQETMIEIIKELIKEMNLKKSKFKLQKSLIWNFLNYLRRIMKDSKPQRNQSNLAMMGIMKRKKMSKKRSHMISSSYRIVKVKMDVWEVTLSTRLFKESQLREIMLPLINISNHILNKYYVNDILVSRISQKVFLKSLEECLNL